MLVTSICFKINLINHLDEKNLLILIKINKNNQRVTNICTKLFKQLSVDKGRKEFIWIPSITKQNLLLMISFRFSK